MNLTKDPVRIETVCPQCGIKHDAASNMSGFGQSAPTKDDVTVCFECGAWAVFDEDLKLRAPTVEEWKELSCHPIVQQVTSEIKKRKNS